MKYLFENSDSEVNILNSLDRAINYGANQEDGECKKDKLNKNSEDDIDDDEREGGGANDSNGKYNANSTSKQINKNGLVYTIDQNVENIYIK